MVALRTSKTEGELKEGTEGVTFDDGETWTVTVTPYNSLGETGPSFTGKFIMGAGGTVTFTGWIAF